MISIILVTPYIYIYTEKRVVGLFRNLIDSISMSVQKRTNQNSCKNYRMNLINSF